MAKKQTNKVKELKNKKYGYILKVRKYYVLEDGAKLMDDRQYTIGTMSEEWGAGDAQSLTFIVTEDCNLRCKYCYITHKSKGKVMNLETAKKFIDYVLTTDDIYRRDRVLLDFIGGEPLLEPKLIENICDYFKIRTYELNIPWYWKYQISVGTNGVNYSDKNVQKLIKKNEGKIAVGITIDGTKEKHDLQRVFPNGAGSYDVIYKNMALWLSQFPGSTKVTFASEDLKYLKESIIHLWNEKVYNISANVVYENVWKDGDDRIYEEQLRELADYIVDNDLYNKYYCTFFLDHVGAPYTKEDLQRTSCGAGKMLALSPQGNIYPCMRYYDYSLNHKEGYIIGNIEDGIDMEKARVFLLAMYKYQCDDECLQCPIAKGCEFCQGFSYDEADSATNFQKAKYICKMHKARVRGNNYYFTKLFHKKGIRRQNYFCKQELIFILDSEYVSCCSYVNSCKRGHARMDIETIKKGLSFAEENFMRPIFLYPNIIQEEYWKDYEDIDVLHRIPIQAYRKDLPFYDYEIIVNNIDLALIDDISEQENLIFNISSKEITGLAYAIEKILKKTQRVNVNITNISIDFDILEYQDQLSKCVTILGEIYDKEGILKEINIITDTLFLNEHEACPAGDSSIAYGPDGQFYVCPAYYSEIMESVGDPDEGIHIANRRLYESKYMPLCQMCDAYQCENCKFLNRKITKEVNVSPSYQCKKAFVERKASCELQKMLEGKYQFVRRIGSEDYIDPIRKIVFDGRFRGYYK